MSKARTPRQTARVKQSQTALAPRTQQTLLSGRAQELYDNARDIKEDLAKSREKRMNALLENARFAGLRKQAVTLAKEANEITKKFDLDHPKYKSDIAEVTADAQAVHESMTRVALEALQKDVTLEVYHGRGPGRKRVRFDISCQPSLF